jgi:tetratricopeptide (TPR) repeat protein
MDELKDLFQELEDLEKKLSVERTETEIKNLELKDPTNKNLGNLYIKIIAQFLNLGQYDDAKTYASKSESFDMGDVAWSLYGNYFMKLNTNGEEYVKCRKINDISVLKLSKSEEINFDCASRTFSEAFFGYNQISKINGTFGNYMLGSFFELKNKKQIALNYYNLALKSFGCGLYKALSQERIKAIIGFEK